MRAILATTVPNPLGLKWANVGLIQVRGVEDVHLDRFNCSDNKQVQQFIDRTGGDFWQHPTLTYVMLSCLLLIQEPSNAARHRLHVEDAVMQGNGRNNGRHIDDGMNYQVHTVAGNAIIMCPCMLM
jgi:hypothetical protein